MALFGRKKKNMADQPSPNAARMPQDGAPLQQASWNTMPQQLPNGAPNQIYQHYQQSNYAPDPVHHDRYFSQTQAPQEYGPSTQIPAEYGQQEPAAQYNDWTQHNGQLQQGTQPQGFAQPQEIPLDVPKEAAHEEQQVFVHDSPSKQHKEEHQAITPPAQLDEESENILPDGFEVTGDADSQNPTEELSSQQVKQDENAHNVDEIVPDTSDIEDRTVMPTDPYTILDQAQRAQQTQQWQAGHFDMPGIQDEIDSKNEINTVPVQGDTSEVSDEEEPTQSDVVTSEQNEASIAIDSPNVITEPIPQISIKRPRKTRKQRLAEKRAAGYFNIDERKEADAQAPTDVDINVESFQPAEDPLEETAEPVQTFDELQASDKKQVPESNQVADNTRTLGEDNSKEVQQEESAVEQTDLDQQTELDQEIEVDQEEDGLKEFVDSDSDSADTSKAKEPVKATLSDLFGKEPAEPDLQDNAEDPESEEGEVSDETSDETQLIIAQHDVLNESQDIAGIQKYMPGVGVAAGSMLEGTDAEAGEEEIDSLAIEDSTKKAEAEKLERVDRYGQLDDETLKEENEREHRKEIWRKVWMIVQAVALVTIAVAVVFWAFFSDDSKERALSENEVIKVGAGTIENIIEVRGVVAAEEPISFESPFEGRVTEIKVKNGDKIEPDQEILVISSPDNEATAAKQQQLDEEYAAQKEAYDEAIQDDEDADLDPPTRHTAETIMKKEVVKATSGGKIQLSVKKDQEVKEKDTLGQVDVRGLHVIAVLSKKQMETLPQIPQTADLFINDKPQSQTCDNLKTKTAYDMEIAAERRKANPNPQPNDENTLVCFVPESAKAKAGIDVKLAIAGKSQQNSTVIPRSAVEMNGDVGSVWIIQKGSDKASAKRTAVELGINNAKDVEVISGLQPGDKILKFALLGQKK